MSVLTSPFYRRKSIFQELTNSQQIIETTEIVQKLKIKEEELDQGLTVRELQEEDFHKGFVELLAQLTSVGSMSFEAFSERFKEIQKNEDQVVIVIENVERRRIVAAGTLLVERKFIHEGGTVGHIEDIVVDETERGKQLGKRIVERLRITGEMAGCYKVILDCKETLVSFYEKCGFTKNAVQMAWYKENH